MRQNLSVEEALEVVLQQANLLVDTQTLPLMHSHGRILATDLLSPIHHPDTDDTAIDGYACLEADTLSASVGHPVRLQVIGQAPAGRPFVGKVETGQAVQVFTGAPIPLGTNAVIRVEETLREGDSVLLMHPASHADIRRKGDDLQQGLTYLHKGEQLTPGRIGLAAAMGYANLEVFRKPKVGILSTGDEVVEPGNPLPYGGVYNSNSYSVAGLVLQAGAEPVMLGQASDDLEGIKAKLLGAGQLDLLLTTGGVSMGEYDIVRKMLEAKPTSSSLEGKPASSSLEAQGQIHFWKVKMQPGGPFLFAQWQGTPLMGLPGNPVSAMVAFLLFGRPFIFRRMARVEAPYTQVKAVSDSIFAPNPSKRAYRRASLFWKNGHHHVATTGNQSSVVLNSMATGNCLVVLEPGVSAKAGDVVEVIPLP